MQAWQPEFSPQDSYNTFRHGGVCFSPSTGDVGTDTSPGQGLLSSSLAYLVRSRLVRIPVMKTVKVVAFKDYSPECLSGLPLAYTHMGPGAHMWTLACAHTLTHSIQVSCALWYQHHSSCFTNSFLPQPRKGLGSNRVQFRHLTWDFCRVPSVDYWKQKFSFGLQERVSEEERKHHEELADLHSAVDEDSRSESSSTDEGKENTRLLLKRLKALEVRHPWSTHWEQNLLVLVLTVSFSLAFLVLPDGWSVRH